MVSLTDIRRPNGWSVWWIRVSLRIVTLFGRVVFTGGRLGDAPGIHFGHWHIIEGGRRYLFCSNYDGSFGGYLDDFINGATIGTTLAWRWTTLKPRRSAAFEHPDVKEPRSFPPTRFAIFRGVKCELKFKSYARDSMLPHLYRFEARKATIDEIDLATGLRDALFGERNDKNDDLIMRAIEIMKVPHLSEQLDDIQGMIGTGFGWLYGSRFWLLTIRDGREDDARKWLSRLAQSRLVVSAADVRESRAHPIEKAVAIAFSYSGIVKLGCKETEAHPFPSPFRSGMGSDLRALLLRDRSRQWRWSDVDGADCGPAHVLIAEWTPRGARPLVSDIDEKVFCIIKIDNDPRAFRQEEGYKEERLREAFGFRDGLAQPVIRALRVDQSDRVQTSHSRCRSPV